MVASESSQLLADLDRRGALVEGVEMHAGRAAIDETGDLTDGCVDRYLKAFVGVIGRIDATPEGFVDR